MRGWGWTAKVKGNGFGNATRCCRCLVHIHMLVWVGVSVKEELCRSVLPSDMRCSHTLVGGCECQRVELRWLQHGVVTLGVRERTAARASLGGHHGTQSKIGSCNGSLR